VNWTIERHFHTDSNEGSIRMTSRFSVDKDRQVILLPWLTLYAGLGSFGTQKYQGLLPGLEYLSSRDSSSNQKAVVTVEHKRRVPDPVKVTIPMMAISQNDRYVGLIWEPSDLTNALFDSPDRLTNTQSHLLGVTGPAVGSLRFENELAAYKPYTLKANQTYSETVTIVGGIGKTVVPAVQHYIDIKGLPGQPVVEGGLESTGDLFAHGWLDSDLRNGTDFAQIVWTTEAISPRKNPDPDAAMYMDWLPTATSDVSLAKRLQEVTDSTLAAIDSDRPYTSSIAHVRTPAASLRFGRLDKLLNAVYDGAQESILRFTSEGTVLFRSRREERQRLVSTHWTNHANGTSSAVLTRILEAATLTREPQLVRDALELLDKQTDLYSNSIPRGAQTWEVPMHAPDILTSGQMVKCYVLGYVLSGKQEYIEQARYWAWAGIPFVYLIDPTQQPIGRYATLAVYGGSHFNDTWFAKPVQWCGLVYAHALHQLHDIDPESGPWQQIARNITASGIQQHWPKTIRAVQGLLPDFYNLHYLFRDDPGIQPGTTQATLAELFELGPIYSIKRLPQAGWTLHAPCAVNDISENSEEVSFTLDGWGASPTDDEYHILIAGPISKTTEVFHRSSTEETWQPLDTHRIQVLEKPGITMTLRLQGPQRIRIRYGR